MPQSRDLIATVDVDAFGKHVSVRVLSGNVLTAPVDAIAFKYAQASYGADRQALELLGIPEGSPLLPLPGEVRAIPATPQFEAREIVFVGTVPLSHFEYAEIRDWSRRAIAATASVSRELVHLAVTTHGAGIGLDETEAFTAQLAGLLDALRRDEWPASLSTVSVYEHDRKRAERLGGILVNNLPRKVAEQTARRTADDESGLGIDSAGLGSRDKPSVFVAMQFGPEHDDAFHYGIQSAVRANGFLCERIDSVAFTGDILSQIKARIGGASFVVADLSTANPNVYLEVGFAWGRNIRTILLCKEAAQLRFDVQGQKCILYSTIRELETRLSQELTRLAPTVAT